MTGAGPVDLGKWNPHGTIGQGDGTRWRWGHEPGTVESVACVPGCESDHAGAWRLRPPLAGGRPGAR